MDEGPDGTGREPAPAPAGRDERPESGTEAPGAERTARVEQDGGRRFRIDAADRDEGERLLAEAFDAGASGAEEIAAPQGRGAETFRIDIHAPDEVIERVRAVVRSRASAATKVGPIERLPGVDWSEAWRGAHAAIPVSSRLLVRPPFVAGALEPGQQEIVIDPGQAFGTGSHASTRLCLDWIDALLGAPGVGRRFDRVLDVGTGSGVLALAALALGARRAVGNDLDPLAIEAARQAAAANGLAERARFGLGPLDSLLAPGERFPLIVANLLKREVLPIVHELAVRLEPGGRLVLSGLLEEDEAAIRSAFAPHGIAEAAPRREIRDGTGLWIGLCLGRDAE